MGTERMAHIRDSSRTRLAMEVKNIMDEIRESFGPLIPEMDIFLDHAARVWGMQEELHPGSKVIATQCIFVPDELVYATGGIPVRICSGAHSLDLVGQEFLPAKTCPLVKATFGSLASGLFPGNIDPELFVIPASCDQKRKMSDLMPADDPRVYTLEVPPRKDSPEAVEYWRRVVDQLILRLEKAGGKKLTRRGLKDSIALVNRAQAAFRDVDALRKQAPVLWGTLMALALNTWFIDEAGSWTKRMEDLGAALRRQIEEGKFMANSKRPRIFLTGAPAIFPNLRLPLLTEQLGGWVIGDDYCSSTRMLNDTVAVDEWNLYDMIPAIADRYLKPCSCPSFAGNDDRVRNLRTAALESGADGVIYQSLTGCYLYDLEYVRVSKALEEAGIPLLYLESDYSGEDSGQLTTRIEAFLESIRARKNKKVLV